MTTTRTTLLVAAILIVAAILTAVAVGHAQAGPTMGDLNITSLVCGQEGARFSAGYASCLSSEEWACIRARDRCGRSPFHPGCQERGYATVDLGGGQVCLYSGPSVIGSTDWRVQ